MNNGHHSKQNIQIKWFDIWPVFPITKSLKLHKFFVVYFISSRFHCREEKFQETEQVFMYIVHVQFIERFEAVTRVTLLEQFWIEGRVAPQWVSCPFHINLPDSALNSVWFSRYGRTEN